MEIFQGQVLSYDSTNHKADVVLGGSMSRIVRGVPVAYQVAAEQMAAEADCGVVFFGESDVGLVICTFGEVPVPPLNLDEYGPTLDIYNFINRWSDHFLGDRLAVEYDPDPDSGCSVGIWGSVTHGWVRLSCSSTTWKKARLWLGNKGDGYATLDVDNGWLMLARGYFSSLVNAGWTFGVSDAAEDNVIRAGYNSAGGPNWEVILNDGGGGYVHVQSDTVADTGIRRHALKLYKVGSVNYLEYWVDSVLILAIDSDSYDIPTSTLTPVLRMQTRSSNSRVGRFDHWAVMPRL